MKKITFAALLVALLSTPVQALQADPTSEALAKVLAAQSDEHKARHIYRHPGETLRFFGIRPGMRVAEALPGGGWYSKVLLPYLGSDGALLGVDYNMSMWPNFSFATDEFTAKRKTWPTTWPEEAQAWRGEAGATVSATTFGNISDDTKGSYDAFLFIRALHNLARYEDKGGYLSQALNDAFALLKPGGVVGIVQHEARADRPDSWADGSNGYLKKSFVIKAMRKAGFTLVDQLDINENVKDQANEGDIVWRLPPSLATSREDPELREKMQAIGESNRMTLLFEKPIAE
ncbi:MAG: class I SAM-dependent methyltransferase [Gammaproteobacteria bacterium]|nr:class I SAM-dependent methyltransferase [Gammaproteobacteria bacterium]